MSFDTLHMGVQLVLVLLVALGIDTVHVTDQGYLAVNDDVLVIRQVKHEIGSSGIPVSVLEAVFPFVLMTFAQPGIFQKSFDL